MSEVTIDDLPDEILEYIFYLLPPYEDVRCCMAVNKKWNAIAKHVIPRTRLSLGDAISAQNIIWETYSSKPNEITRRYSHSVCRHRDSMFVFGGFTSSFSSFNDLWRLNLSTKKWSRISVEGKCPVPKAGATMVTYKNKLILFGGILPSAHSILQQFQPRRLSNHVHTYDISTSRWDEVDFSNQSQLPGLAGHSSSIHKDKMIIFGGLYERVSANNIFSVDLINMKWRYELTVGKKPPPRYNHSQVYIDENHLLIMGGLDSPEVIFDDVWLLDMSVDWCWRWSKVDLGAHTPLIKPVCCHPVCKVGKYIVIFKPQNGNPSMYSNWFPIKYPSAIRAVKKREVNLNGKRGTLHRPAVNDHQSDRGVSKKYASDLRGMREFYPRNPFKTSPVEMHAFDISQLLIGGRLQYVRCKTRPFCLPIDAISYSIIEGNGELIMFGGVQSEVINYEDGTEEVEIRILNTLRIIKIKKKII